TVFILIIAVRFVHVTYEVTIFRLFSLDLAQKTFKYPFLCPILAGIHRRTGGDDSRYTLLGFKRHGVNERSNYSLQHILWKQKNMIFLLTAYACYEKTHKHL